MRKLNKKRKKYNKRDGISMTTQSAEYMQNKNRTNELVDGGRERERNEDKKLQHLFTV